MRSALLFVALLAVAAAPACCGVGRGPVAFGGQRNLIVWNEETKTEHFVRIANFQSKEEQMGFLAPTPETPKLTEVDGKVFSYMDSLRPVPADSKSDTAGVATKSAGRAGGVDITQMVRVGGYVATTFKADDPSALAKYLEKYGFKMTAPQTKWLTKYVDQKWMITAFQVDLTQGQGATKPIRMTFKSDRPYNPYYVPADNHDSHNHAGLAVYFVSDGQYKGALESGAAWKSEDQFQVELRPEDKAEIASNLKLTAAEIGDTLSVWSDYNFPAPVEEDLFFKLASSETPPLENGLVRSRDYGKKETMSNQTLVYAGGVFAIALGALGFVVLRKK